MTEQALPILLSVPHAGLSVPSYLRPLHRLELEDIKADGDVGAREIYDLASRVKAFVTTDVARAFVDMNRAPDDWRKDGVVKTHTCWDVEIYGGEVPKELLTKAIEEYHAPYHAKLSEHAKDPELRVALDCHTMADFGPPVGPDCGQERPLICLGDAGGTSCPTAWVESLRDCLVARFEGEVTINEPFSGGYITRTHGQEMPWIQVELSRTPRLSHAEKQSRFLSAVTTWADQL